MQVSQYKDLNGCWHIKGGEIELKSEKLGARDLGKEERVMTLRWRT